MKSSYHRRVAPRPERRSNLEADIEYDIVALRLSATEIAAIVMDATGKTVDPKASRFLNALDTAQLQATRKRMSENTRWRPLRPAL
jgi:hypothetical protein